MAAREQWRLTLPLLLSLALLSHQICQAQDLPTIEQDTNALRELKQAVGEPSSLESWSGRNPCSSSSPWTGVTCDVAPPESLPESATSAGLQYSYITTLSLASSDLEGTLPDAIGDFLALKHLDLSSNNLTGSLPSTVGNLRNLTLLQLSHNSFQGKLPVTMRSLWDMVYLDLSNNNFSGIIPPDIRSMRHLQNLRLQFNHLVGPLRPFFARFKSMIELNAAFNRLNGRLPAQLSEASSLRTIMLTHNHFNGEIPTAWGSLTSLVSLRLTANNLSGSIPSELTGLSRLKGLFLNNNSLTGDIPPGIPDMRSLRSFFVMNNRLSGRIGPEFKKFRGSFFGNPSLCLDWDNNGICHNPRPRVNLHAPPSPVNITVAQPCAVGQVQVCACSDGSPGQRQCLGGQGYGECVCRNQYYTSETMSVGWVVVLSIMAGALFVALAFLLYWAVKTNMGKKKAGGWEYAGRSRPVPDVRAYRSQAYDPDDIDGYNVAAYDPMPKGGGHAELSSSSSVSASAATASRGTVSAAASSALAFARKFGKGSPSVTLRRFPIEEMQIATSHLSPDNVIATDGLSRTFRGTLSSGESVAIKEMPSMAGESPDAFAAAADVLASLRCPQLVAVVGCCSHGTQRLLVYELVPNGSLDMHLHDLEPGQPPLDWTTRMAVLYDAAKGLAYLHSLTPPMCHQQLQSSNTMIDDSLHAKLADYSLSSLSSSSSTTSSPNNVSLAAGTTAPELAWASELTPRVDVYAFGVLLLEVMTGRRPIDNSRPPNEQSLVRWAKSRLTQRSLVEAMVDPRLQGNFHLPSLYQVALLASQCIHADADARPTMAQALDALAKLQGDSV